MMIRSKLVVWVVGLFTVVVFTAGAASVFLLRSQLIGDIDAKLRERTEILVFGAERGFEIPRPDIVDVGSQPDFGLFRSPSDMAGFAVDTDGTILFSLPSGPAGSTDPLPDISEMDLALKDTIVRVGAVGGAGPEYRALATPIDGVGMTVVLAIPIDDVRATIASMTLILLGIGFLSVVALGALVWWVIRKGLRPIDDMIDAAGYIGDGDLSHRVPTAEPGTEVGQLATALNAMLNQIETAVDEKTASEEKMRRFLSDASHELRTPLTSIRGYAELYRHGATTPEEVERSLSRIERESTRMGGLVDDLLLLARLDQDRPLAAEPVDLVALIGDTVDDARAVEPERPILVRSDGEPALISGDEDKLRQALGNLMANVRQHTPSDAEVSITLTFGADEATIEVADSGSGVPQADADRVFERFYQIDAARKGPGSGLGLSIVQAIVTAHGGDTKIKTDSNDGFTVTIHLPAAVRPIGS